MELSRPFAENGDRIDFPEDAQGDGDLSLEQGFGPRFALPPEESGLFIDRQKYNQLMYLVTKGVIDAKEAVELMKQQMTEGLGKLTEFGAKLDDFTTRLDSLEDEVANIDESLIGGKVTTLIDEDVFITVGNPGSGAQFERLEDALYEGMKYKPINYHFVFIVLKTNLTIDYPIILYGVDMSHIVISGWFDGTQGQVKPPMKEWKRIYYDVENAVDRAVSNGQRVYALISTYKSQIFSSYNVVWSMKAPVDMTEINTKYSKKVLQYNTLLLFSAEVGDGRIYLEGICKETIEARYKLDVSVEKDFKGLSGSAAIIISATNAFIGYGGVYSLYGGWVCSLDIYATYIKNGAIDMSVASSGDIGRIVFHYTNKTPIVSAYMLYKSVAVRVTRTARYENYQSVVVTKEEAIGYDYYCYQNLGGIASLDYQTTSPDFFYGKAPNLGLSNIAINTVTPDGIIMSHFTYEQAKAAVRPYPTVYDEIYPDEPNWNQSTDYNPNTAWKPTDQGGGGMMPPPVKKKVATELEVTALSGQTDYTKTPYVMDSVAGNTFKIGVSTMPPCTPPTDFYAEALNQDIATCDIEGKGQYLTITAKKAGTATFRIHAQATSANTDIIEYTETLKDVIITINAAPKKVIIDEEGYPAEFYLCNIKQLGQAWNTAPLMIIPVQAADVWNTTESNYKERINILTQRVLPGTRGIQTAGVLIACYVAKLIGFFKYNRAMIESWLNKYAHITWTEMWKDEVVKKALAGEPY